MYTSNGASLVAQLIKNLPAMQETQVQFLVWEDPLEKEMATHSSVLSWIIPWSEEFSGYRICLQCRRPRFNSWFGKIP